MTSSITVLVIAAPASEHVSGAESGAERAENRLERSGAVSGQNLPLKIRSTVNHALKVKFSKLSLKVTTKLSV